MPDVAVPAGPPRVDPDRVVPLDLTGDGVPLYCVHAGSGSAYHYRALAARLDHPVRGIEAPGFDDDREPVRSVTQLADEYAATLRACRDGDELALLGWSVGGFVAVEAAQRLTAAGVRVTRVVLVDVSVPDGSSLPPEHEIAQRFVHDLLAAVGPLPAGMDEALATVSAGSAADDVFEAVAGLLPSYLDVELLDERYPVFRALVDASYGFEPSASYDVAVTHVIASASPPAAMRWGSLVPDLTEPVVAGDHHSVWSGAAFDELVSLVRSALRPAS